MAVQSISADKAKVMASELHTTLVRALESGLLRIYATCSEEGSHVKGGILRAGLAAAKCTCHVGYYSNAQIIANLMHLVVQLAIFPPDMIDHATQTAPQIAANQGTQTAEPINVEKCVCGGTTWTYTACVCDQNLSNEEEGGRLPVRIGGGYHLVGTPVRKDRSRSQDRSRSPDRCNHSPDRSKPASTVAKDTPLMSEMDKLLSGSSIHDRPAEQLPQKAGRERSTPLKESTEQSPSRDKKSREPLTARGNGRKGRPRSARLSRKYLGATISSAARVQNVFQNEPSFVLRESTSDPSFEALPYAQYVHGTPGIAALQDRFSVGNYSSQFPNGMNEQEVLEAVRSGEMRLYRVLHPRDSNRSAVAQQGAWRKRL